MHTPSEDGLLTGGDWNAKAVSGRNPRTRHEQDLSAWAPGTRSTWSTSVRRSTTWAIANKISWRDVRFISSPPVMQPPACTAWADKRHVQIVWAVR